MTKNQKSLDNDRDADYNSEAEVVKSSSPDISDEMFREEIVLEEFSGDPLKKLREKMKKCVSEKQEYLDGWQRAKADFINYKKDEGQRKSQIINFAKEDFIQDVLPVLDSFNLAKDGGSWNDGLEQIWKQFLGVLKKEGVKEINPEGEDFDPNLHEAIELVEVNKEGMDNVITEVAQMGYKLNDKLIRPAKVKVGQYKKH